MERKDLALLCAGTICFWLFVLAFGTAQEHGLRESTVPPAVQTAAVQTERPPVPEQPELSLNCRAACLIDQDTGTVLYEKMPTSRCPLPPSPR